MTFFLVFIIISLLVTKNTNQKQIQTTLGVHDRVALLKYQIAQEIKKNQLASLRISPKDNRDIGASYEYVDIESKPVTPIMDFNERKRHEKYKHKEIKTTTEYIESFPPVSVAAVKKKKLRSNKKKIRKFPKKPKDIFYRRYLYDTILPYNTESTHCQDLITPYYTGHKSNMTNFGKWLNYDNPLVVRLAQLLGEDLKDQTKEDIYSIMFQISNLQIRLFQWDVTAVKLLLNSINKEYAKVHKKQTFRSVKRGLKAIFQSWHLDFTNTTNLLKQSRLFRPPCVRISGYEGSTKTPKAFHYTKKPKQKRKCSKEQEYEDCY